MPRSAANTQPFGPSEGAKPLVVQTEDLSDAPAGWLSERANLVRCAHHDEPRFGQLLGQAEGLVVRTYTKVDAALLERAPRLRVVGRAGVALENIDIPACRARGVEVVHTPGSNTRAVVEYAWLLILDALRARTTVTGPIAQAAWDQIRRDYTVPRQLSDMTLGVLGLGKIGSSMARVAQALEMRCVYHDIRDIPSAQRYGAELATPHEVLARSDIVSIHIDPRPTNAGYVGRDLLRSLKADALVINTSRGFVLDARALVDALSPRPNARAILDVHDPFEPIPTGYPLLGVPNVTLLPHLAACTETAKENMSWVVRDVWRVLCGEKPSWPAPRYDSPATAERR